MINYLENRSDSRVSILLDGEFVRVSAIRKGAVNEHIAKAWLLKQGYEVFANISPEGPADLVAVNFGAGETLFVDVKSRSFTLDGEGGALFRDRAERIGIRYLIVDDEGDCSWCERPTPDDRPIVKKGCLITVRPSSAWVATLEAEHGPLPTTVDAWSGETGEVVSIYYIGGRDMDVVQTEINVELEKYAGCSGDDPAQAPDWLAERFNLSAILRRDAVGMIDTQRMIDNAAARRTQTSERIAA